MGKQGHIGEGEQKAAQGQPGYVGQHTAQRQVAFIVCTAIVFLLKIHTLLSDVINLYIIGFVTVPTSFLHTRKTKQKKTTAEEMTVTVAYLETKALPHLEYQSVLHYWEVQSYSIGNTSHPSFPVTSTPCQHLAQQQFGYPERNDVIHPQLRVIAPVTQLSLNCLSLRLWLSEMPKHMLALNTGIKPLMSCGGQSRRLVVPSHSRNALAWSLLCFIPYHDKHLALTSALQLKRCNKIDSHLVWSSCAS